METLTMKKINEAFDITVFHKVEKELRENFDLRYNIVAGFIEYRKKEETKYSVLEERNFNSLFCQIGKADISCNLSVFNAIVNSDFVKEFDPFAEYFSGLKKWDGQTDYINQLAETIQTTNTELWKKYLKKWLVASVACCTKSIVNHTVLVLSGKQGIGKSRWLNGMLPKALLKYLFTGTLDPRNKDSLINLAETMFINLDELENLNKNELGALKSLITQASIRVRRPYARFHETMKRRASIMGSINDVEFLTDTTGNTRYLCFSATSINYEHQINMDDVYAQALHLLENGEEGKEFKYYFTQEDMEELNENNKQFTRMSVEEELIRKYFTAPVKVPKDATSENIQIQYLTPTEIIYHINKTEGMPILAERNLKKLGQVMLMLDFQKKSTKTSKPYGVIFNEVVARKPFYKD